MIDFVKLVGMKQILAIILILTGTLATEAQVSLTVDLVVINAVDSKLQKDKESKNKTATVVTEEEQNEKLQSATLELDLDYLMPF